METYRAFRTQPHKLHVEFSSCENFRKFITLVFVPKCVLARKNESSVLVSNTIDLGEDSLDEDGVDLDEEDNMLDICFDIVAREGDISPRQQRSGSNKRKKKTYGRQHS
ncbi:hypothetical protein H5410_059080 [Solanum commersonii]|uniref:Uncharacterized protein n=1 Tax=Solanum commersonii TaxID=4109 RepID=A0A9J5W1I7_SOLCO|nr:hypothetical protein H5410_059080 [Solanum commersonii]